MSKSNGKTFDRKMLERELANMEPENQILVKSLLDAADSGSLQKQLQKMAKKGAKKDEERQHEANYFCAACFKNQKALPKGKELMLCSGCNKAKYCSKECQVADWKTGGHKKICKTMMRNPDRGESPVYDRFEEWKEKNISKLQKIFRSLLFKEEGGDEGSSFNLCDDHIAILCINYIPSEANPFQISSSQAVADAFFVEGRYHANDGLVKHGKFTKDSFQTLSQHVRSIRIKINGEKEKLKASVGNKPCAGIVGIMIVGMAPEHGTSIVKTMPELATLHNLAEDTSSVDRNVLTELLNRGLDDLSHHVFNMTF